jgi:hypothetical protein
MMAQGDGVLRSWLHKPSLRTTSDSKTRVIIGVNMVGMTLTVVTDITIRCNQVIEDVASKTSALFT